MRKNSVIPNFALISALTLLIPSLFFHISPEKFPADDGFFYQQIAYNVFQGNGFTFNEEYQTNGFHPLWMIFSLISELFNPFEKQFSLHIIWFFQVLFVFLSLKNLSKFWGMPLANVFSSGIICYLFIGVGTLYLTEAHLNLYCLSLLFLFFFKKSKVYFLLGILSGLAVLARLDNVFVVFPLAIYYLFVRERFHLKNSIQAGIGFSVLIIPYLTFNYFYFGHIVPISGVIKSSFPNVEMRGFNLYAKVFLYTLSFYLIYQILTIKQKRENPLKLFFTIGCLLQLLYNIAFQSQIGQWYFVAQILCISFFAYDAIELISKKIPKRKVLLLTRISLIIVFLFISLNAGFRLMSNIGFAAVKNSGLSFNYQPNDKVKLLIEKVENHIPNKSKVYVYDAPGKMAFYSNLRIIPADGLINDFSYNEELTQLGINEYLKKHKINYLIIPSNSALNMSLKRFPALNVSKNNGLLEIEYFSPKEKISAGFLDLSLYDPILREENPLIIWQKGYDEVLLLERKEKF